CAGCTSPRTSKEAVACLWARPTSVRCNRSSGRARIGRRPAARPAPHLEEAADERMHDGRRADRRSGSAAMSITTELCRFATADGQTLHGLLFGPVDAAPATDLAVVAIHGVAMNFYSGPQLVVGQMLAERGYHALVAN